MFTITKRLSAQQIYPVFGGLILWLCCAAMFGRMSIGIEYSLLMGSPRFLDGFLFFIIWLASSLIAARMIGVLRNHFKALAISLPLVLIVLKLLEFLYDISSDTIWTSLNFLLAPASHFFLLFFVISGAIMARRYAPKLIAGKASNWLLCGVILQASMLAFYFIMSALFPLLITQERRLLIILIGFVLASLNYSIGVIIMDETEKRLRWKAVSSALLIVTSIMASLT